MRSLRHICIDSNTVSRDGRCLELPSDVAELLWYLEDAAGDYRSPLQIRAAIWGADRLSLYPIEWRTRIAVLVSTSRQAIKAFGGEVQNRKGTGYRLVWINADQARAA